MRFLWLVVIAATASLCLVAHDPGTALYGVLIFALYAVDAIVYAIKASKPA